MEMTRGIWRGYSRDFEWGRKCVHGQSVSEDKLQGYVRGCIQRG